MNFDDFGDFEDSKRAKIAKTKGRNLDAFPPWGGAGEGGTPLRGPIF